MAKVSTPWMIGSLVFKPSTIDHMIAMQMKGDMRLYPVELDNLVITVDLIIIDIKRKAQEE